MTVMMVGWLARALVAAEYHRQDIREQAAGFLTSLFRRSGGWRGWSFSRPSPDEVTIDVYEAQDSEDAGAALHRAGFTRVTIHQHERSKAITCACPSREVVTGRHGKT